MQIGEELCDRFLQGNYQYVLAVHTDKDHIHCHIIFNNTNLYNGLSFTTEHNQGKVKERAWAKLREISDRICEEHGLSVIEPKGKGISHFEHDMKLQGKSWKDKLRVRIAEAAFYSKNLDDFFKRCTECGIEYVYKPMNKVSLKFRLKDQGQQKFTRAETLGEDYTAQRIAQQIAEIQKSYAIAEQNAKRKASEKSVTKSEPELIQPEKNETKCVVITGEEFIAPLLEKEKNITSESVQEESISPEKKADVWAEIRGMNGADKIIKDLEAGGITSLDELKSFFWNNSHSDDHTEELAVFDKKIKGVDKLIKMMKQRSQHSATYKEYLERSALTQNHFRNKNAFAIDSYEKADKYIRKHIKEYYVDGKAPKRSELAALSKQLKDKRKAIMPEHKAYLLKHDTAFRYTRQVRQYLNEQYMKREREKSRQRTQAKHRNKNALE